MDWQPGAEHLLLAQPQRRCWQQHDTCRSPSVTPSTSSSNARLRHHRLPFPLTHPFRPIPSLAGLLSGFSRHKRLRRRSIRVEIAKANSSPQGGRGGGGGRGGPSSGGPR